MATLQAFSSGESGVVHALLGLKVAEMMGRKMEEGDWAEVYCRAKGLENHGWSNLNIDVMAGNLGVEHKMLCYRAKPDIASACGSTLMHPSATRSIRIPSVDTDPDEVKDDVLEQYRDLIAARTERVEEQNGTGSPADMRTGWLLWQTSLRSFLYFEEPMVAPDPEDFTAVWKERGTGSRKGSRNLWIYEKASGRKRFSVTTAAGIKIQPYFDVPPRTDPNVYVWQVVGEPAPDDMVRMWITSRTARALRDIAGRDLSPDVLESVISQGAQLVEHPEESADVPIDALVEGVLVPSATYQDLVQATGAMNDEHALQLILEALLTV